MASRFRPAADIADQSLRSHHKKRTCVDAAFLRSLLPSPPVPACSLTTGTPHISPVQSADETAARFESPSCPFHRALHLPSNLHRSAPTPCDPPRHWVPPRVE